MPAFDATDVLRLLVPCLRHPHVFNLSRGQTLLCVFSVLFFRECFDVVPRVCACPRCFLQQVSACMFVASGKRTARGVCFSGSCSYVRRLSTIIVPPILMLLGLHGMFVVALQVPSATCAFRVFAPWIFLAIFDVSWLVYVVSTVAAFDVLSATFIGSPYCMFDTSSTPTLACCLLSIRHN